MRTACFYVLAISLFCFTAVSPAANLLPNPGLEIDDSPSDGIPDGWWNWGMVDYTAEFLSDPSEAYAGSDYAHLRAGSGGAASCTPALIPVDVGQTYIVGGYAKDLMPDSSPSVYGPATEVLYYDGSQVRNDTYKHIVYDSIASDDQYYFFYGQSIPIPAGISYITNGGWVSENSEYNYDDFYCGIGLPGGAEIGSPDPTDTQTGVSLNPTLSWVVTGSYASPIFHVYFGTNVTDVTNGAGGTYKGGQGGITYPPSTLLSATTYHWRIDVEDGGQTYPGVVWQFSTVTTQPDCLEVLIADTNNDCVVDGIDLQNLGIQWMDAACTPPFCADLDQTDGVHLGDLSLMSADWKKSAVADVVINEFMASNTTVLADEDLEYPDWIELKNVSGTTINLDGWYLTDNSVNTNKWRIPNVSINAGGYLVIFASAKDRFDPLNPLHTNFTLDINGNYLGLYRPDLSLAHEYGPEYPVQAEDISYGLTILAADNTYTVGYFLTPTNGAENSISVAKLGPYIENVTHLPTDPSNTDPLVVTATVTPKIDPVGPVTLYYRVMFGVETSTSMYDDGTHNDGAAGDGVYGATIPSGIASPGKMIRYYITAVDTSLSANDNRSPLALDLTGMRQSPEYHGTVVADPALTSNIAVLHWFVQDTAAADNTSNRTGTRASFYFNGEFYDNAYCRIRGQSIAGWDIPNKSYKFEFNRGYYFRFSPLEARVDEFNLSSNIPDKAYIRQDISFESFRDAGGEYCETFPMRVHRNGQFFSVQTFIEQVDGEYLERNGLDPDGAMYKMYTTMNSIGASRKKTRENEDTSDLQALINGIALSGAAREQYIFDNLNLPSIINYAAVNTIINEIDHGAKNYYAYRDTNVTGEWRYLPWDKELTFGKQWSPTEYLLDDTLFYYNRWSSPGADDLQNGGNNRLLGAIYSHSRTNEMYHRRLRTLCDLLLQAPGTAYAQRYYENRADELETLMTPDTTDHYNKWGNPWYSPHNPAYEDQSFADAIGYLKTDYLDARRTHIYVDKSVSAGGPFVNAQVGNPAMYFGLIDFNPSSGNQDEEYIQLINPNAFAVDISGWKLTVGVSFTFEPGTVIPGGEVMYVSPNLAAFRARSTSPTGGEAIFVRGNYKGHLSSWGETINLLAADDSLIDTYTYVGAPSDQQRYLRVTELMYHPTNPTLPSPYNDEDFEYIELMNIGTSELDLGGVKFTNGVLFDFPTGTPTITYDSLVGITDLWRYEDTDTDLGTSWRPSGYVDSSWPQGAALLYNESAGLPAPKNTPLTLGSRTFYFRTHFNLSANPVVDTITLEMNTVLDDGAVFYINGTEVYRLGMHPTNPYDHSTLANRSVGNAVYEGPFVIPSASLLAGDNVLAVEVHQTSTGSSDVVFGLTLDATIESAAAGTTPKLAASEIGLVVKNTAAFESRYGTGLNVMGQYTGSLSNAGEEVKLEDPTNSTILEFDFNDTWYGITDGDGFSLNIIDVNDVNLDIWDDKDGWRPSTISGGTPGSDDVGALNPGDIVINELLAHSDTILYDWIELHNTTASAINIGGWFISDSGADDPNRMKYEIAAGTMIAGNGYIVFYENLHFGNPGDPGSHIQFQFSENGETAYLQSGQGGVLTGYYEEEDFGASQADIAFGRYYKASTDTFNFVAMSSNTAGSVNVYPKVGPIIISEIMYHPPVNSDAEYIELLNISGSSVTLYDSFTSEPWQFIDDAGDPTPGLEFYFPTAAPVTMAAGEYLLLVKNLTAFNSVFTPPGGVTILEWTTGSLGNGGEEPLLSMPGDVDGLGQRQYIRIDKVNYSDGSHPVGEDPWPTAPDGGGSSLSRITSINYGNDVINWQGVSPTPGSVNP